ncbi:hydroxyacylglutathione hydrolase [Actinomadura rubteroloni]|uniref:Hydroxyacylglutathione hydrolase n=1 Tax=Actinomadura rubteroloni TaxID=1926885 RepID=A0A2P4UM11_9ACTN|nr:MBL fold metallo-hydrolase [Actinomadura rubteroloni]POM26086.1 hydroxyacylglutathione hydrolase [Actinomadura rubteroloni]
MRRRRPLLHEAALLLAGTSALRHLERIGWNPFRSPDAASGRMGEMSEIDGTGTERTTCVLAPNPSMMTLDGTNTWIIAEPGAAEVVVVDPGPNDGVHLRRIADTVKEQGRRVGAILITHRHPDHSEGAGEFARLTGAGVRAVDPAHRHGAEGLADGDVITTGGLELRVVAVPGHTDDSVAFWLPADRALLTGDTVLGRGTPVLDGSLGDYLRTLERLRDLVAAEEIGTMLPGHGPLLADPAGTIDYYIRHRRERLAQVRKAVAAGATTAGEVVAHVYGDIDRKLWPIAEWTVQAQLDYLAERD